MKSADVTHHIVQSMATNDAQLKELTAKFQATGLNEKQTAEALKSKLVRTSFDKLLDESPKQITTWPNPTAAPLLLALATATQKGSYDSRPKIAAAIIDGRIKSPRQVEAAVDYLKGHDKMWVEADFENASGIGITVTEGEIKNVVAGYMSTNKDRILEDRYLALPLALKEMATNPFLKWADPKLRAEIMNKAFEDLLGPKDKQPVAPAKKKASPTSASSDRRTRWHQRKEGLQVTLPLKQLKEFSLPGENVQLTPELKEEHLRATGGKVVTRFPPEPNGYLHIGHSKAITVNFGYAKHYGGRCYLRYDDTNPEAEEEQYFTSIKESVEWLGFEPYKITYSSDHFQRLYDLAEELIKRDKGYICHCTAEEVHKGRGGKEGKENPRFECVHRNRPIEESLREFRAMKDGKYKPKEAFLRMKQDILNNPNPNMWDLTAYRVLEHPHHRTGSTWRVYPTYDFTHCLCDSFENITHSLCTTEFVLARESYEWLCDALGVFKPAQREYGRLNLSGTIMSKRKILKLVQGGYVRGWDDPRLYTLVAIRRRGIPPGAILSFVGQLGVTPAYTTIDIAKFENIIRGYMDSIVPRLMMVLDPIPVILENLPDDFHQDISLPYKKGDASYGEHTVPFTKRIYIERDDFRINPTKDYNRLSPNGIVGLFNADFLIQATSYTADSMGRVTEIRAKYLNSGPAKVKAKAYIHWVADSSKDSSPVKLKQVRLFKQLFKSENPESNPGGFLADLDPHSEESYDHAIIDIGFQEIRKNSPWRENEGGVKEERGRPETVRFQAMRTGYFCLDKESSGDKFILNRIVGLKQDAGF